MNNMNKDNKIENSLAKEIKSIKFEMSIKMLLEQLSHIGDKTRKTSKGLMRALSRIAYFPALLFRGLHIFDYDYKKIEREYEKRTRSFFVSTDIGDKSENPLFNPEGIIHKSIDKILHIGKKDNDKPKRGRPTITQLCETISDSNVVKMAKKCYLNIYRKALKFAQNITQYLVCFLYSLFGIPDNDTETVYGKVSHFRRIMSGIKGLKIPSVRRLQQMLKWFMEWKAAVIRTAKEMKEEITHRAWEKLVEKIKRQFEILIPQYAMC